MGCECITIPFSNHIVQILHTIDFKRNERVPYESLNDLVDAADFQINGIQMNYFDLGDSWEVCDLVRFLA